MLFNFSTEWNNVTPDGYEIWPDNYDSHLNAYRGGIYQQAVSALPVTDQVSYELLDPTRFQKYGFEYQPSVSRSSFFPSRFGEYHPSLCLRGMLFPVGGLA